MRLLHLAEGVACQVWAVRTDAGACQVADMLKEVADVHPDLAADMAALMLETTPEFGPPLDDIHLVNRLHDDLLWEFKAHKYEGRQPVLGLRVAFFFDGPRLLVCTNAFYKTRPTPQEAKVLAMNERMRYFQAKDRGELLFEVETEEGNP